MEKLLLAPTEMNTERNLKKISFEADAWIQLVHDWDCSHKRGGRRDSGIF